MTNKVLFLCWLTLAGCVSQPIVVPVPDLNGIWGYSHLGPPVNEKGGVDVFFPARDGSIGNFEKDFAVLERADENMPLYKPEYWAAIRELDHNGVADDPIFNCRPAGVPRIGAPQQIVQNADTLVFLYTGQQGPYRVIHLDGRELSEAQHYDYAWYGYSTGEFDGDRLTIKSRGFNDQSWLGWAGWIHSADMTVTETLWRDGDSLHWVATVEDTMLLEPWTTNEQTKTLNSDPSAFLWETPPCEEMDREHMVEDTRG
ncbi:MAG: hypothetical protein ACI9UU_003152 [Candidatus Azotimanducaceae bacterium]|jgi:hypothetical protein